MKHIFFVLILLLLSFQIQFATAKIWKSKNNIRVEKKMYQCKISDKIQKYNCWQVQFDKLKNYITKCESSNHTIDKSIIEVPSPDGSLIKFKIQLSNVMSPELQKQFPDIKSYSGNSITNPSTKIRIDLNESGFHALITANQNQWLIEPYCINTKKFYVCYFKSNYSSTPTFNESR
jgi:hypothetical protein